MATLLFLLPVFRRRRPAQSTSRPPPANMTGLKISNVVSLQQEEEDPLAIKPSFLCPLCDKTFGRKEHVASHLKSIHANQRRFQCPLCSANFNLGHSLNRHQKRCFAPRSVRFPCSQCPASYATAPYLKRHIRRKHAREEKGPWQVPLMYQLIQHNDQWLTQYFPCRQCTISFTTLSDLYLHVINKKP
jgi:uncharacterized Zn-finger protein